MENDDQFFEEVYALTLENEHVSSDSKKWIETIVQKNSEYLIDRLIHRLKNQIRNSARDGKWSTGVWFTKELVYVLTNEGKIEGYRYENQTKFLDKYISDYMVAKSEYFQSELYSAFKNFDIKFEDDNKAEKIYLTVRWSQREFN